MYSIEINFLKDRDLVNSGKKGLKFNKPEIDLNTNAPIIIGGSILVVLPLLSAISLWFLNSQQAKIQAEIKQFESQIKAIEAKNQSLQQLRGRLRKLRQENKAFANIFTQIKPWSALLQDISDQIPSGVQIASIEQRETKGNTGAQTSLVIKGFGRSYDDVNDFLLTLQRADFLTEKGTRVETANLTNNPTEVENEPNNVTVELPQLVGYTIITQLNNKPANDLLPVLERKGAVGLVSRIRTLTEQGLIQQ